MKTFYSHAPLCLHLHTHTPAAIKFVDDNIGSICIRIRLVSTHSLPIDSAALIAFNERSTLGLSSAEPFSSHSLAAGLASGTFSRSLSLPPALEVHPLRIDENINVASFCVRGLSTALCRCCCTGRSPTAVSPSTHQGNSSDAASDSVTLSSPSTSYCDPRLPFESTAAVTHHMVNVPASAELTSTVHTVRFEVKDNGRGLSQEQIASLFKPYAQVSWRWRTLLDVPRRVARGRPSLQVNPQREHGGTGLGLYICMRLTNLMGGSIGVESAGVGCGATFWVDVPLRVMQPKPTSAHSTSSTEMPSTEMPAHVDTAVDRDAVPAVDSHGGVDLSYGAEPGASCSGDEPRDRDPSAEPGAASSSPTSVPAGVGSSSRVIQKAQSIPTLSGRLYVLIVDDVDSIRMLMKRLLRQHAPSAVLFEATNGEHACEIMAAAQVEGSALFTHGVVCMDKEMPRCDGFAATRRIRAMGFAGLILGITGNAIPDDISAFLDSGVNAVLTKPMSVSILMGHIRDFVNGAQPCNSPIAPASLSNRRYEAGVIPQ